jgi:hypothetical protein
LSNIIGDCKLVEKIKGKPLSNPSYLFDVSEGFERGFPFILMKNKNVPLIVKFN